MMSRLLPKTSSMSPNIRLLLTPLKAPARNIQISTQGQRNVIKTLWSPMQHGKVTCLLPTTIGITGQRWTYSTDTEVQKKSTALSVIKDLKHLGTSPAASLLTGLGGLIPFMSVPAYMLIAGYYSPVLAFSQIAYGASILSFLGGIRWGITIPEESPVEPSWFNIGYSVTPSLLAWVGLMFPTPMALCTLMAGMGGALYMDLTLYGYPAWFRALRFILTIVAILSLWTTLVLRFTLKSYEQKLSEPPKPVKAETKEGYFTAVANKVKPTKQGKEKLPEDVVVKELEGKKTKVEEPKVNVKENTNEVVVVEEEAKELKD